MAFEKSILYTFNRKYLINLDFHDHEKKIGASICIPKAGSEGVGFMIDFDSEEDKSRKIIILLSMVVDELKKRGETQEIGTDIPAECFKKENSQLN
jgi:hypothetical protein